MEDELININSDSDRIALIKTVAEAASSQAKITNRLWLAVIANTIILFQEITPAKGGQGPLVKLPFGLAEVQPGTFYPMATAMLSSLIVGLAVAHAQQIRTDRIAQYIVGRLTTVSNNPASGIRLHLRDVFDILRQSTLTRVAPLCQLVARHFHTEGILENVEKSGAKPSGWKLAVPFLVLKALALIVLFGVPAIGLWIGFQQSAKWIDCWLAYVLGVVEAIAVTSLGIVAYHELKYIHGLLSKTTSSDDLAK
jgi:hypothetical protein